MGNDKNTEKHHPQERQEVSPFYHKVITRLQGTNKTLKLRQLSNMSNKIDAQDIHHLGTVSFIMPFFGSKHVHCEQHINSFAIYRFTRSGILVFILGFHWVRLRSILPY